MVKEKKKEGIKCQQLNAPQMNLLLTALGYKLGIAKCQFCKKKLKSGKYGIYPSTDKKRKATLVCESFLCICTYLEKIDD